MNQFTKKHLKKLVARQQKPDTLALRESLALHIGRVAVDGKVKVVESGIDCDGVRYWGHATTIPASVMAFVALDIRTSAHADGPYHLDIDSPKTSVTSGQRDLALEAFEDGHPHVIYGY